MAQVIDFLSVRGGSEKTCRRLAVGLAASGSEVLIVHGEKDAPPAEDGVETEFVEGLAAARLLTGSRRVYLRLKPVLKRFKPDVVHFRNFDAPLVILAVSRYYPVVRTVHTPWTYCPSGAMYDYLTGQVCRTGPGYWCFARRSGCWRRPDGSSISRREMFGRYVACRVFARVDRGVGAVVVTSAWMKDFLTGAGGPADRIYVVPPPVDVPAAPDGHVRDGNGRPTVLSSGRFVPFKGFDDLVRAAARVRGDVRFVLVGDGPGRAAVEALACELGVSEKVRFTGWVDYDELGRFYAAADVFVIPSKCPEAFGNVGVEAGVCALPVVAYDTGGVRSWLEDGVNGLLVRPGDVNGLARALSYVLAEPERAREMGARGRAKALHDFSLARHVAATVEVYARTTERFNRRR